jgi:hypothetical protein
MFYGGRELKDADLVATYKLESDVVIQASFRVQPTAAATAEPSHKT